MKEEVTGADMRAVREATGCGIHQAVKALREREYIVELAIEYVNRCGLACVMSDAGRYPKWTAHKKLIRNPV